MFLAFIVWIFLVFAWFNQISFCYSFILAIVFYNIIKTLLSKFSSIELAMDDSAFFDEDNHLNNC